MFLWVPKKFGPPHKISSKQNQFNKKWKEAIEIRVFVYKL